MEKNRSVLSQGLVGVADLNFSVLYKLYEDQG